MCVCGERDVLTALGGFEQKRNGGVIVVVDGEDVLGRCYDHREFMMSWEEFLRSGGRLEEWRDKNGEESGENGCEIPWRENGGRLVVVSGDGEDLGEGKEEVKMYTMKDIVQNTLQLREQLGLQQGFKNLSHLPFK